MAIRKIVVMGHPVLRQVAAKVPEAEISSPKIQTLIRDMVETMFDYDGRGLAAPQIDESLQIVVILWDFDADKEPSVLCLINPELEFLTQEKSSYWEGCLSVPGLRGLVSRPNKLRVKALNQSKENVELTLDGFAATVVQHECDHLLGKLYLDRIEDMTKFAFNREYQRFMATPETAGESEGPEE